MVRPLITSRDPYYFISFSASKESLNKYIKKETGTEIDNLQSGSTPSYEQVRSGPLDNNGKLLNHPLWNLKSIKNGKIFEDTLRCIIIDIENDRIYDSRLTM